MTFLITIVTLIIGNITSIAFYLNFFFLLDYSITMKTYVLKKLDIHEVMNLFNTDERYKRKYDYKWRNNKIYLIEKYHGFLPGIKRLNYFNKLYQYSYVPVFFIIIKKINDDYIVMYKFSLSIFYMTIAIVLLLIFLSLLIKQQLVYILAIVGIAYLIGLIFFMNGLEIQKDRVGRVFKTYL